MYTLLKTDLSVGNDARGGTIIEETNRLLADSSAGLEFEPGPHVYRLHGREVPSVSEVVGRYAPFNSEAMARKCAGTRDPKSRYYGMDVQSILAMWEEKRDRSAEAGTAVHAFGEACFLHMTGHGDSIEEQFRDRLDGRGGLVALSGKEEAAARWWASLDWERYVVVAKETRLVNPVLDYAGTFDLLVFDTRTGTFVIKDYKTNEDLFKWYGEWLSGPFHRILKNNDEGRYTLQQNLYRIQMANIGLPVSAMELIWLKEDGSFQEVPLRDYDRLIRFTLKQDLQNENIHR